MPEEITNDKNNALLENLLTIAKLHWPAARISEMEPQIVQTVKHLEQIIQDIPDPELAP